MGGWLFAEEATLKKKGNPRQLSMDTLFKMGCKGCPLDKAKNLRHPKMDATGSSRPLIYILGEGPGVEEDKLGKQFVGKSGRVLRGYIPEFLLNTAQIRWNNTINCHKEKNATPTPIEITCCKPRLVEDIERTKPKAIFGFGGVPLRWAIDEERITAWRGMRIPLKVGNHYCWYYPFFHPSYLARLRYNDKTGKSRRSEQEKIFEKDIDRAFAEIKHLPDAVVVEGDEIRDGIEIIMGDQGWADVKRIKAKLKRYARKRDVAFDYETDSNERSIDRKVRPYGRNARILTIAVGTTSDTIAFPIAHREAKWTEQQLAAVIEAWILFLKSDTQKVAHHLFFELEWTLYFFGLNLARCCTWHDTMTQGYILGRPTGTNNLDALILTHFGFRLKDQAGASLNRGNLDMEPLDRVLMYNALDTKWTHALFDMQYDELEDENLVDQYEEQVRHIPTVTLKSFFGVLVDFDTVIAFDQKYSPQIKELEEWFKKSKYVAKFKERMGREFKPSSPQDVLLMLRNVMGRKECRVGEDKYGKPQYSTKDSVLEQIPLQIAKNMQKYRAVTGSKSKYVDPLLPKNYQSEKLIKKKETGVCVWPDGMTHAVLQTQFLVTRRTSCHFPNEQFWTKRNKEFADLRSEYVPPTRDLLKRMKEKYNYELPSHVTNEDCWYVAIDYGQMQARIAGMVSRDKMYCGYLWDKNDLHQRWTEKLAYAYPQRVGGKKFIKDPDVLKTFRNDVKNQWTFPLIFGATANSVSQYLHMPVNVLRPMIKQFFREMPGLANYQKRMRKHYDDYGYVETPCGFRRYGPMDHGEIINTPIQGGEAEIVLNAMDRLSEAAEELDEWQFQARLEIHDELAFWIPKKTFDRDIEFLADYMLECEHFPWITVPLCIEISKGPNWYDLEEVSELFSDDFGKLDRKACGF